jgi:hypothetical protein
MKRKKKGRINNEKKRLKDELNGTGWKKKMTK